MILTVIFFIVALICNLVPTALFTVDAQGWAIAGLLSWAVDVLLGGGYVLAAPARRAP